MTDTRGPERDRELGLRISNWEPENPGSIVLSEARESPRAGEKAK